MKATRIAVGLTVALVTAGRLPGATTAGESNTWSAPTNGLQARLRVVRNSSNAAAQGGLEMIARPK